MTPLNLRTTYGDRYSVRFDEAKKAGGWTTEDHPWLMQIRGTKGFISLHTEQTLAVVAVGKAKSRELAKLAGIDLEIPRSKHNPRPGWHLLQFGDWELRCGFPITEIDNVAKLIGARQRKPAAERQPWSLERKAELVKRLKSARLATA